MLPEPVAVTLLVIEALEGLGVPYLIGGSLASAVHGVARATVDGISNGLNVGVEGLAQGSGQRFRVLRTQIGHQIRIHRGPCHAMHGAGQ